MAKHEVNRGRPSGVTLTAAEVMTWVELFNTLMREEIGKYSDAQQTVGLPYPWRDAESFRDIWRDITDAATNGFACDINLTLFDARMIAGFNKVLRMFQTHPQLYPVRSKRSATKPDLRHVLQWRLGHNPLNSTSRSRHERASIPCIAAVATGAFGRKAGKISAAVKDGRLLINGDIVSPQPKRNLPSPRTGFLGCTLFVDGKTIDLDAIRVRGHFAEFFDLSFFGSGRYTVALWSRKVIGGGFGRSFDAANGYHLEGEIARVDAEF